VGRLRTRAQNGLICMAKPSDSRNLPTAQSRRSARTRRPPGRPSQSRSVITQFPGRRPSGDAGVAQPVHSELQAFAASVVALSCVLALVLGAHGALAQTDKTSTPGQPCTLLQQLSVGMDLNLPIGTSLAREDCALPKNPSVTASWLTGVGLVIRGLCGRSQPCSLTTAADPCARHNPRAGRCIRRRSNAQAGVHGFA
jgi:hypothetical protein